MSRGKTVCAYKPCGAVFYPVRPWQRFCCRACHDAWWKEYRAQMKVFYEAHHDDIGVHPGQSDKIKVVA